MLAVPTFALMVVLAFYVRLLLPRYLFSRYHNGTWGNLVRVKKLPEIALPAQVEGVMKPTHVILEVFKSVPIG